MKKTLTLKQQKKLTIKNLKKVLRELPKLVVKMPEIKKDFDMKDFGVYDGLLREELSICGAVGCLLGNSARIFEDEFNEDLFIYNIFDYTLFGKKYFPYLYSSCIYGDTKWDYLFSGGWERTKYGDLDSSLNRIKNLLENDLECNTFDYKTNKIINLKK